MNLHSAKVRFLSTATLVFLLAGLQSMARAQPPAAEVPEADPLVQAAQQDPLVAAVLEMPRETPSDMLQMIFTLLDLGATDAAAAIWQSLEVDEIGAQQRSALVNQFGTARLLQLGRQEKGGLFAGAAAFVDSSLEVASEASRSPERIEQLIADLQSDSAATRQAARADIGTTGTRGAKALIEALAEAESQSSRANLLLGISRCRPVVDPMLLAVLAEGEGQVRRDIVELLGHLDLQDALPGLGVLAAGGASEASIVEAARTALLQRGYPIPSNEEAAALLRRQIDRLRQGILPGSVPMGQTQTWWSYDPESGSLSQREVETSTWQTLAINRFAQMLAQLARPSASDRQQALAYAYQAAELLGEPLPEGFQQQVSALSTEQLNAALGEAMASNHLTAAISTARLLGERGDASALRSRGPRPTPLVAALSHAERRLRFAALEAVMKISPQETFAGASAVAEALWEFAQGAGQPQAVVGAPALNIASTLAGQLRRLDYEATPTATGRDLLEAALAAPRLAAVFVDSDITRPTLREVVYQLHANKKTAQVPIAILASNDDLVTARQLASDDPWLLAQVRPRGEGDLEQIDEQLRALAGETRTAEQRTEQAASALRWIAQLLREGHPYDELIRGGEIAATSLHYPPLTEAALEVLAVLGTAESQVALVNFASTQTVPIEARRAAVGAFANSVQRFGLQLDSLQLNRQYDRYNASETADAATQQVLSRILDILEGNLPSAPE